MGLGGLSSVSLAGARGMAEKARRSIASGVNPIEKRRQERIQSNKATFGQFADELVPTIVQGYKNEKHRKQWATTLLTYAAPLRDTAIEEIGTDDVLMVLQPIWLTKSETASRVRGRIERVLDAAKARGLRSGENPARWRGHLSNLLPKRPKLSRGHLEAMPFVDVPAFIARLRDGDALSRRALEFLVFVGARSNEVRGMRWDELDNDAGIWTVPAERMKGGRPHRVPITPRMGEILEEMSATRIGELVFPGRKSGRPQSDMTLTKQLRRMGIPNYTVHGFRSSFRDWVSECTSFDGELAELQLSHVTGDATELAYRRLDQLEKRRKLMSAWANYCGAKEPGGIVTPISDARK